MRQVCLKFWSHLQLSPLFSLSQKPDPVSLKINFGKISPLKIIVNQWEVMRIEDMSIQDEFSLDLYDVVRLLLWEMCEGKKG